MGREFLSSLPIKSLEPTKRDNMKIMAVITTILLLIFATTWPVLAFHYWSSEQYISMLERIQKYDAERADYFFNGANKRGLLDICKDASGKVDVLWKEDCK